MEIHRQKKQQENEVASIYEIRHNEQSKIPPENISTSWVSD
jgi:hypothetical protein